MPMISLVIGRFSTQIILTSLYASGWGDAMKDKYWTGFVPEDLAFTI